MTPLPSKVNSELAKSYFQADYALVCDQGFPRMNGWALQPSFEDLILFVDMWATDESGSRLEDYHLKLDMSYYKSWPPSVMFVNPGTMNFDKAKDMKWFPKLAAAAPGTGMGLHAEHGLQDGTKRQLICNSMVLEYYLSNHNPSDQERWDSNRHNFGTTLNTIQLILRKPYYGGPSESREKP
jgi:hypothetical protein